MTAPIPETPESLVSDRDGNVWRKGVNRWHPVDSSKDILMSTPFLDRDFGPLTVVHDANSPSPANTYGYRVCPCGRYSQDNHGLCACGRPLDGTTDTTSEKEQS